ncbi:MULTISPECIES: hypothetical protein [unclassified Streptomyces]|uniref:hypothetical protein n=1 Tax=unclassified Streptomyces TaxID=2593676 RepID=UPI002E14EFB5|nr:hypothetical protein OG725_20440 [Streptomyces sp. NBC_01213]WSQ86701.1 hypothetical protein OG722_21120 [Streptomyces sp. NBC_01212]
MGALPNAAAQPVTAPRLLPWPAPGGKPCFLVTDDGSSHLSRLADEMEAVQLEMGVEILDHARAVLGDTMSPYSEVRYAGIRLAECLSDALRVAESRGMRLPCVPDEGEGEDTGDVPTGA